LAYLSKHDKNLTALHKYKLVLDVLQNTIQRKGKQAGGQVFRNISNVIKKDNI